MIFGKGGSVEVESTKFDEKRVVVAGEIERVGAEYGIVDDGFSI